LPKKTPVKSINKKCAICGHDITSENAIQCQECEQWVCEECGMECENCEEMICKTCSHQVITRHQLCTECYQQVEEAQSDQEEPTVESPNKSLNDTMFLVYNAKGLAAGANYHIFSMEEFAIDYAEELAETLYPTVQPYREKMKALHILKLSVNNCLKEPKELEENKYYHFRCPTKGCNCAATRKWRTPRCKKCGTIMVEKKQ